MGIAERFQAYADAFEQTYVDDDWSRLEQYFTEDAVYEGAPEDARGRNAVLAKLKASVDTLDRRMDARIPEFQKPTVSGNTLTMIWKVTYTKAGCPDLELSGSETAVFEGERIALMRDDIDPAVLTAMNGWMAEHGGKLEG